MSNIVASVNTAERSVSIKNMLVPLLVLIIGVFMVLLDSTAMYVMLPRLISTFGSSYNVVQWTITGYTLAEAAVIPLSGWLCDRFGAKRIFLLAVGSFTAGSLLCVFAQGIEQLIIFRIIQGLGGGMVIPIMFAYTYRLSPPEIVGKVMGLVFVPITLAAALGPVLAGVMVEYVAWQWMFLINIPLGIIVILVGKQKLPGIERQTVAALDIVGLLLAPLAFASLSYGISEGSINWGSAQTMGGLSLGIIALVLFVLVQLRRTHPLLELRVFQSGSFTWGIFVLWIAQFAQYGTLFLISQILQNVVHYSAFEAGLIMLPYALFAGVSNQLGGQLFDKFGVRPLIITGMSILAVSSFLFSRVSPTTGPGEIILLLILIGSSVGLCVTPLYTHLLQVAPQHLVSRVSSLTSATQQVMTTFAIAGLATIVTARSGAYSNGSLSQIDAWSYAFRDTFLVVMFIAIAGAVLGFTVQKPKLAPTTAVETTIERAEEE